MHSSCRATAWIRSWARTNRSLWVAILCGILATALGLFTEFQFAPFIADESLAYFLTHLFALKPITQLMIAAGGFIGFWIPFRRTERR